MSEFDAWKEVANLQAEITRLKDANKELVEALKRLVISGEMQLDDDKSQQYVEVSKTDIRKAIKALAKAKELG